MKMMFGLGVWLFLVVFFVLWLWAFIDMLMKKRMKTGNKVLLIISFIIFNGITAIVWWIYKLNKYKW